MNTTVPEPRPRLGDLDPRYLQTLLHLSEPARFTEGEKIFHEGDIAERLWLISSGRILLHTYVPGRGDIPIETLTDGDLLGLSWLTAPYRWHFAATALSATRAHVIDTVLLRESSVADPAFGYAVACAVSCALMERLQATRARLLDLYGDPVPAVPATARDEG